MTGMGRDGVDGLRSVIQMSGTVVAQDAESSVVHGMPRAADETGLAHAVESVEQIARRLRVLNRRRGNR
ncbi:MAG: hypothetical protein CMJ78_00230 [Planctomycetaceae bacterium]|nr:hypothetical protein [Planctomycetaceae bacterium]